VVKELYSKTPAPGLDKLLLRLLQAGVDPNVAKKYFGALILNNKSETIKLLRQYGADFNFKCKEKDASFHSSYRNYDSLKDFADAKGRYDCVSAIKESITRGKELYERLDAEYRSSQFRENAVANKESIFAHVLRLPEQDEKMEALGKIVNNEGPLGMIFWSKRGRFAPTATNGTRAVAGAALAYFTDEQKRAAEKEKAVAVATAPEAKKEKSAPPPSSTARLHAPLEMSRTQPASVPAEMRTVEFNAAMDSLPDVLSPVYPRVEKEKEEEPKVRLHS
jgi:hypothetical protein